MLLWTPQIPYGIVVCYEANYQGQCLQLSGKQKEFKTLNPLIQTHIAGVGVNEQKL
jgi:hypothetical protein